MTDGEISEGHGTKPDLDAIATRLNEEFVTNKKNLAKTIGFERKRQRERVKQKLRARRAMLALRRKKQALEKAKKRNKALLPSKVPASVRGKGTLGVLFNTKTREPANVHPPHKQREEMVSRQEQKVENNEVENKVKTEAPPRSNREGRMEDKTGGSRSSALSVALTSAIADDGLSSESSDMKGRHEGKKEDADEEKKKEERKKEGKKSETNISRSPHPPPSISSSEYTLSNQSGSNVHPIHEEPETRERVGGKPGPPPNISFDSHTKTLISTFVLAHNRFVSRSYNDISKEKIQPGKECILYFLEWVRIYC